MGCEGEVFGFDRLEALVEAGGRAQEIHDSTARAVEEFEGRATPADDRSLVVISRLG